MIHKAILLGTSAVLCLLAGTSVHAQSGRTHNLYIEAGGPGLAYSLNYDTRFNDKHNGLGIRGGVGFWTHTPESLHRFVLPIQLNYLIGGRQHLVEIGAGPTLLHSGGGGSTWSETGEEGFTLLGTISAGYRFQPIIKGINARAGGTFTFSNAGLPALLPALSVGYTFSR